MKRRSVDLVGNIAPAVEAVSRDMSRVAAVIKRRRVERSQGRKTQMLEKQMGYDTNVGKQNSGQADHKVDTGA